MIFALPVDSRDVLFDGDNSTCINTTTSQGLFRWDIAVPQIDTPSSFFTLVLVGNQLECGTQEGGLQLFMNTEITAGLTAGTCQSKKMKRCKVIESTVTACHFECACLIEFGGCIEALVRKSQSNLPEELEQLCEIIFI